MLMLGLALLQTALLQSFPPSLLMQGAADIVCLYLPNCWQGLALQDEYSQASHIGPAASSSGGLIASKAAESCPILPKHRI
jgi:hypothetical protein